MNNLNEQEFSDFLLSCKKNVLKMAKNGGCFIGSAFSCIDILAYLYSNIFDIEKIKNRKKDRDILILSKGHAVAALYGVLAQVGIISKDRLENYLTIKDDLYWHPNPNIPGIEFHTGSMGHGLSIGIGMAFASKLNKINNKIFVILGDGELNEGSVWESVLIANAYKLNNLVVIIDRNFRQANLKTEELIPLESLQEKFSAFGWETLLCHGHAIDEIQKTFEQISKTVLDKPRVIIANTVRGNGIPLMEDNSKYWFGNFNEKELEEFHKMLDEGARKK
uniref:Transketolase domain-containing protein (TktA, tktB) n=1 Tax=uncultured marine thaumarchaeote AD1000_82_B05 TaxID=1455944 RepID=A0A075G4B3_9ARCH|nr:transketolase domain-containing protein (tktA, tktB) [uncultured marine thaumarchaeote AD1000_82_B05]